MDTKLPFAIPSTFEVLRGAVPIDVVESFAKFVDDAIGKRSPGEGGGPEMRWSVTLLDLLKAKRVRSMQAFVGFLNATPIPDMARDILGGEIAISVQGTSIRDFRPDLKSYPALMHYDATVMGVGTPMLTSWIPLDPVGESAPSLIMSTRPNWPHEYWQKLVDGSDENGMLLPGAGASLAFSHHDLMERGAREAEWPFVEPVLALGDALLFDHQRIHGTQVSLPNPQRRRSLEIRYCSVESAKRVVKLAPGATFGLLGNPKAA